MQIKKKNHNLFQHIIYLPLGSHIICQNKAEKQIQFWFRLRFFYQQIHLHSAISYISQTQFHLHFTPDLECFSKHCAIWITIDALKISTFLTEAKCEVFKCMKNMREQREREGEVFACKNLSVDSAILRVIYFVPFKTERYLGFPNTSLMRKKTMQLKLKHINVKY